MRIKGLSARYSVIVCTVILLFCGGAPLTAAAQENRGTEQQNQTEETRQPSEQQQDTTDERDERPKSEESEPKHKKNGGEKKKESSPSITADPEKALENLKSETAEEVGRKLENGIQKVEKEAIWVLGTWTEAEAFAGITWFRLAICFGLIIVAAVFEQIVRSLIYRRLRRAEADSSASSWVEPILEALVKPLSVIIWAYGIYLALFPLIVHFRHPDGSNTLGQVLGGAVNIVGTVTIIWFIYRLVGVVDFQLKRWTDTTEDRFDDMLVHIVGRTLRVIIILIGAIMLIQNLTGIEIGALVASLGLGGLAFALAAKDSVANLFGTVTILADQPFRMGDRIIIDGYDGMVESVGFRTTRIRTLTGHLVSIPNSNIINSALENVSARPHLRWNTEIEITYDTPPEKVERAVEIIKEIINSQDGLDPAFPTQVHFNAFKQWSLGIAVYAWYTPPDYWAWQNWVQNICVQILKRFNEEGIEMAFPTSVNYLAGDEKRELAIKMLRGNARIEEKTGEDA